MCITAIRSLWLYASDLYFFWRTLYFVQEWLTRRKMICCVNCDVIHMRMEACLYCSRTNCCWYVSRTFLILILLTSWIRIHLEKPRLGEGDTRCPTVRDIRTCTAHVQKSRPLIPVLRQNAHSTPCTPCFFFIFVRYNYDGKKNVTDICLYLPHVCLSVCIISRNALPILLNHMLGSFTKILKSG
jgi:hypothetical protein